MKNSSGEHTGATTALGRTVHQRRRHARVLVNGKVRLVADTAEGVVVRTGHVVDLSISGCALRLFAYVEPEQEARLEVDVDGRIVWLPGRIQWTRKSDKSWIVGVAFDRLVAEKQALVVRMVGDRQRVIGS